MQTKLLILFLCLSTTLSAQQEPPIDGLFATTGLENRRLLSYPSLRQADIVYQKRQLRSIDTRELINLPFRHPELGFFQSLVNGVESGELVIYDPAFPDFSHPIPNEEWLNGLHRKDTVPIYSPTSDEVSWEIVENEFDADDIIRYRVSEIVFFDRQTSTQRSRIIGIAPLAMALDENGVPSYEYALGWIYWPHARTWFEQQQYYVNASDQAVLSWADALEMRRFNSHIIKQSNVSDNRLADHYSGRNLLLKSQQLEAEQANREHDMWSY